MADLSEKMGPLPMWGWIFVVAAIGLLYLSMKSKQSQSPASATSSQSQLLAQQEAQLSAQQTAAAQAQGQSSAQYGSTGFQASINGYNGQAGGRLSYTPAASQSSFSSSVPTTAPAPGGS